MRTKTTTTILDCFRKSKNITALSSVIVVYNENGWGYEDIDSDREGGGERIYEYLTM